jgi:hypothetical protein
MAQPSNTVSFPGEIKKENLAERFGGMPDAPMMTSKRGDSASERRYQRKMAAWEAQRGREIQDADIARQERQFQTMEELRLRDQMLQEAAGRRQEEEYTASQEVRARMEADSINFFKAIRGGQAEDGTEIAPLDPQSDDFSTRLAEYTMKYPFALENKAAAETVNALNKANSTWMSTRDSLAKRDATVAESRNKELASFTEKLAKAGLSAEDFTTIDDTGNEVFDRVAASQAIGEYERTLAEQKPVQAEQGKIQTKIRDLTAEVAAARAKAESTQDEDDIAYATKTEAKLEAYQEMLSEGVVPTSTTKAAQPKEVKASAKDIATAKKIAADPSNPKNKAAQRFLESIGEKN